MESLNEPKQGFWGVLARKAKSFIEDEHTTQQSETPDRMQPQIPSAASRGKVSLELYLS